MTQYIANNNTNNIANIYSNNIIKENIVNICHRRSLNWK